MSDSPKHSFNIKLADNQSMSSDFLSDYVNIDEISGFSLSAEFSGAPMGILQVLASDDNPVNSIPSASSFAVISDSSQGISAAGTYRLNYDFPRFRWIKFQYVRTSGTGTLNARINSKR